MAHFLSASGRRRLGIQDVARLVARDVPRTVRFIRHVGAARFASRQPAVAPRVALCACSRLRIKAPSVWHADGSARKARGVAVDATSATQSHTRTHTQNDHLGLELPHTSTTPYSHRHRPPHVLYLQSPFPEPLAPQETCRKRRVWAYLWLCMLFSTRVFQLFY